MPKLRGVEVEITAGFLVSFQSRMDAIGPWTVHIDANDGNVCVEWDEPASLKNDWVPLSLRFNMGPEVFYPGVYDPDEVMFEQYEMFVARRDEFVSQLRSVVADTEEIVGPVESGIVQIHLRRLAENKVYRNLLVSLKFTDDDEHGYDYAYYPDRGVWDHN
ncbi:MAG: hypothetical protein ACRC8S_00145 [Fimbriiglobus sp.]